jgi:hypothetical protein
MLNSLHFLAEKEFSYVATIARRAIARCLGPDWANTCPHRQELPLGTSRPAGRASGAFATTKGQWRQAVEFGYLIKLQVEGCSDMLTACRRVSCDTVSHCIFYGVYCANCQQQYQIEHILCNVILCRIDSFLIRFYLRITTPAPSAHTLRIQQTTLTFTLKIHLHLEKIYYNIKA